MYASAIDSGIDEPPNGLVDGELDDFLLVVIPVTVQVDCPLVLHDREFLAL